MDRTRGTKIDETLQQSVADKLQAMMDAPPPPKPMSASELLRKHGATIRALHGRGYTYADIAAALRDAGLSVQESTVKSAVATKRPQRRSRSSGKNKPAAQEQAPPADQGNDDNAATAQAEGTAAAFQVNR